MLVATHNDGHRPMHAAFLPMIDEESTRSLSRVTAWVLSLAVTFLLFFLVNKLDPFRAANPFGEDPYDAVGSFAVQLALLVALMSFSRVLRLQRDVTQRNKSRLVVRGNLVVLVAIMITLGVDTCAVAGSPPPATHAGRMLMIELAALALLTLLALIAVARVAPSFRNRAPRDLTPADAIDDLLTLARVPRKRRGGRRPPPLLAWKGRLSGDALAASLGALSPRTHPWRFACATGVAAGAAVAVGQLREGLPPNLAVGLRTAAIFVGGEMLAVLLGFALLGAFLGLRPSRGRDNR